MDGGSHYEVHLNISGDNAAAGLAGIREGEDEDRGDKPSEKGHDESSDNIDYGESQSQADYGSGKISRWHIGLSKKIMGLLRYGNQGRNREKATVPPLGWRTCEEIGSILGHGNEDILKATQGSYYNGLCRYEFSDGSGDNPSIRPCPNTNNRHR